MTLAVAIVGCGWFSRHHREAWNRVSRARVVAVVDPDPARLRAAVAEMPGAQAFTDMETMLDQVRPDLVDIVTPVETHAALAAHAAHRGIDVICQKPLAPDLEAAGAMIERAERAGTKLIVHENFRFRPWFVEARRLIETGAIGTPVTLDFRLRTGDGCGPEPYAEQPYFRSLRRFLLQETGIHFVDVFRALFGEIDAVSARIRRRNPVIVGEDAAVVLFGFRSGAAGIFDGDRCLDHPARDPRYTLGTMLAEGDEGALRLDGDARLFLRSRAGEERPHSYHHPDSGYRGDSVHAQIEHVVAHLLDGAAVVNTGRAYLRNMEIVEAAYRSASEGRTVSLPCSPGSSRE